jgi:hypothetical protein
MNILIPTNINDITLEQYQRFALINNEETDKEFFVHKTIEIFCEVDILTVNKFPFKDATDISKDILDVLDQNVPFTNKFDLDGITYGFIPDLQQMSLGEFIDLEENLRDSKNFHKAAAVMFRPTVKQFKDLYTIESYEADPRMYEVMKKAPVGVISAAIVFFYNIVNELLAVSQDFSKKELKEAQTIVEKVSLQRSMGGLTPSMLYAEALLQNTEKSPE